MKVIIEAFVSTFLIIVLMVSSVCALSYSADVRNAQNFHSAMVTEIEASDGSVEVINDCRQRAEDNGYKELQVTNVDADSDGEIDYYDVTLIYRSNVPIINMAFEHKIEGFAR